LESDITLVSFIFACSPDSYTGMCTHTLLWFCVITLRAKLSGAVYCYQSCLFVCNGRGRRHVFAGLLLR